MADKRTILDALIHDYTERTIHWAQHPASDTVYTAWRTSQARLASVAHTITGTTGTTGTYHDIGRAAIQLADADAAPCTIHAAIAAIITGGAR